MALAPQDPHSPHRHSGRGHGWKSTRRPQGAARGPACLPPSYPNLSPRQVCTHTSPSAQPDRLPLATLAALSHLACVRPRSDPCTQGTTHNCGASGFSGPEASPGAGAAVPPLMARWEPSKCSPIWCEAGGRRGAPSLGPSQAEPLGMFWSPLLVTVLLTACLPRPGALLWGRAPRHWLPPWGATLPTHGAGAGETEAGPSEVPSRNGQGAVWEAEGAP